LIQQCGHRFIVQGLEDRHMTATLKRFLREDSGATAIEYGLIAALVAVAAIAGFSAVGTNLETLFNNIKDQLIPPPAEDPPPP
jgi:pilus assembly protein Flp/PilA